MDTFSKIAESVVLEHQIAELMSQQKTVGWPFDVRKAQELENKKKKVVINFLCQNCVMHKL